LPLPVPMTSPALSLMSRPGDDTVRARRVAILVAPGIDSASARMAYQGLVAAGAVPRFVGQHLGQVEAVGGAPLNVEISIEAGPAVLYDAVVIPDGKAGVDRLCTNGQAVEFVKEQYRHCKPILVFGDGANLLKKADISTTLPAGQPDSAILGTDGTAPAKALESFVKALALHRKFDREMDPPAV